MYGLPKFILSEQVIISPFNIGFICNTADFMCSTLIQSLTYCLALPTQLLVSQAELNINYEVNSKSGDNEVPSASGVKCSEKDLV